MVSLYVNLAIGIAVICTANAAPAQVQSDQTATDQKVEAQFNLPPLVARGIGSYIANRFGNGEEAMNQDNDVFRQLGSTAIKTISSYLARKIANGKMAENQDAEAADLWGEVGPSLIRSAGEILARKIADGEMAMNQHADWEMAENQKAKAQIWPILGSLAVNYLANRIANGESIQNEEADAQFWGTVFRIAAPYIIDKFTGGEIAMSEVAKALPEKAKAEFWPMTNRGLPFRILG